MGTVRQESAMIRNLKFILLSSLIQIFAEECKEKQPLQLNAKLKMKCLDGKWVPIEKRGGPPGPPCEDDRMLLAQGFCSANQGQCNQYTKKGVEMDKDCPGTCGSCDGCRCQDHSQWHTYCPFWAQYCDSPGVLGTWMGDNYRKTCNKCKCNCCSYKGNQHALGARIPLPDQCGELVCEEGLVAGASPLLPGASLHNVSHPEELTLSFKSVFPGFQCCILPADAEVGGTVLKNQTMVQEGWSGKIKRDWMIFQATCCHGNLMVPLQDNIQQPLYTRESTTTTTTTTSTTTTTTTFETSKSTLASPGLRFKTTLYATCDNFMRIYLDGELAHEDHKFGTDTYQWATESQITIPSGTRVLGIECLDAGGGYGILASTANGLITDQSWTCTSKQNIPGWSKPGFTDTNSDFSAPSHGLGNPLQPKKIAKNAKWIWGPKANGWAFCKISVSV